MKHIGHASAIAATALAVVPASAFAQLPSGGACSFDSRPTVLYDRLDAYWAGTCNDRHAKYHSLHIETDNAGLPRAYIPDAGLKANGLMRGQGVPYVNLYKSLALLPDRYQFYQIEYFSRHDKPFS